MSIPIVEWNQREAIPQEIAVTAQPQTVWRRFVRVGLTIAMLVCVGIILRLAS